jgi:hypothetical protein
VAVLRNDCDCIGVFTTFKDRGVALVDVAAASAWAAQLTVIVAVNHSGV